MRPTRRITRSPSPIARKRQRVRAPNPGPPDGSRAPSAARPARPRRPGHDVPPEPVQLPPPAAYPRPPARTAASATCSTGPSPRCDTGPKLRPPGRPLRLSERAGRSGDGRPRPQRTAHSRHAGRRSDPTTIRRAVKPSMKSSTVRGPGEPAAGPGQATSSDRLLRPALRPREAGLREPARQLACIGGVRVDDPSFRWPWRHGRITPSRLRRARLVRCVRRHGPRQRQHSLTPNASGSRQARRRKCGGLPRTGDRSLPSSASERQVPVEVEVCTGP